MDGHGEPAPDKAGFAPWDVLEEYTRPARLVEHGHVVDVVVKEPLSEPEFLDFPGVGTLTVLRSSGDISAPAIRK